MAKQAKTKQAAAPAKVVVVFQIVLFGAGGALAFGSLLDSLSNAISLVTPRVALVGTGLACLAGVYAWHCSVLLKSAPNAAGPYVIRWGRKEWAALGGILLVLWAPYWLPFVTGPKGTEESTSQPAPPPPSLGETAAIVEKNRTADGIRDVSLDVWTSQIPDKIDDFFGLGDSIETVRYDATLENGELFVGPKLKYLEEIHSQHTIGEMSDLPGFFHLTFPKLDFKLQNNSGRALFASRLLLQVKRSTPDPEPIPLLEGSDSTPFILKIHNEGWGSMRDVTMEFAIEPLRKNGGDQSIPQVLPFTRQIPVIEQSIDVDLAREFVAAGIDVPTIQNLIDEKRAKTDHELRQWVKAQGKFASTEHGETFVDTRVTLTGRLSYKAATVDGPDVGKVVPFVVTVYIGSPGGGGAEVSNGDYQATLRPEGVDYEVTTPINNSLDPVDTHMFTLRLGAERSSVHEFTASIIFADGREIKTKPIRLSLLVPRTNAAIRASNKENEGRHENTKADPRSRP